MFGCRELGRCCFGLKGGLDTGFLQGFQFEQEFTKVKFDEFLAYGQFFSCL